LYHKHISEKQLQLQQYSVPAQRVCTTVKLLCREMPDVITAPNMWLLNISDFSPVDYRILAMLQEWVCQYPMQDDDNTKQCQTERQTVTDQATDRWWFGLMARVMARSGQFKHLT